MELIVSGRKQGYDVVLLDTRSFLLSFLLKILQDCKNLRIVLDHNSLKGNEESLFKVTDGPWRTSCGTSSSMQQLCSPPCMVLHDSGREPSRHHVAGFCSVARRLVQNGSSADKGLLGFKSGCLLAPAEASPWTRFIEIDCIQEFEALVKTKVMKHVPKVLARLEAHLRQPLKLHNVYSQLYRLKITETHNSGGDVPINIERYAEGFSMSLSDVLLYPITRLLFSWCPLRNQLENLPCTQRWLSLVAKDQRVAPLLGFLDGSLGHWNPVVVCIAGGRDSLDVPVVPEESLYKRDVKRFNPKKRIFTKQEDIELALSTVSDYSLRPYDEGHVSQGPQSPPSLNLDWKRLPAEVGITESLPEDRLVRKQQQLESLVEVVCSMAEPGSTIVDFCSGGGHVGILLAYLLPRSRVVLVENKERSLKKAEERLRKSCLSNVVLCQCNLDYFVGPFDVGVALHACGSATDLVLKKCVEHRASFVLCPCCYGAIRDNHLLSYPLSDDFRSRFSGRMSSQGLSCYLSLAHGSDQTHSDSEKLEQGRICMRFVDEDRLKWAETRGYRVKILRLKPPGASPKDHLIVGSPKAED